MRFSLMAAILLAGAAATAPALAQRTETVEQRVNRLEQELRAVQRRVFPGGRTQFVQPEIGPQAATPPPVQVAPTGGALSSLSTRLDALETQLRTLTGQVEEQGFRTRQLEQQVNQLRTDLQARLAAPASPSAAAPPETPEPRAEASPEPAAPPSQPAPAPAEAAPGSAEAAYNAGYRLWSTQRFGEAQQALEAAATRYPGTRWTSWIRNLQGRAYLDDGKPASAARIFLANYQDNPHGERAADSLYYLGQALTRLNRRPEACRVYAELEQVYPSMRAPLRAGLPQAKADARCSAEGAAR